MINFQRLQPYAGFHDLVFVEEFRVSSFYYPGAQRGHSRFRRLYGAHDRVPDFARTRPYRYACAATCQQRIRGGALLEAHPLVEQVSHPGLSSHPDYELAQQILPQVRGAVFSFELAVGVKPGEFFIENLSLFSHLAQMSVMQSRW